jgi:hypothetical protein
MKKIKTHELFFLKKKTQKIRMNYKSPKIRKKNPEKIRKIVVHCSGKTQTFLIVYFTVNAVQLPPNDRIANGTATFTFSQYAAIRNPNRAVFSHYDSTLQPPSRLHVHPRRQDRPRPPKPQTVGAMVPQESSTATETIGPMAPARRRRVLRRPMKEGRSLTKEGRSVTF